MKRPPFPSLNLIRDHFHVQGDGEVKRLSLVSFLHPSIYSTKLWLTLTKACLTTSFISYTSEYPEQNERLKGDHFLPSSQKEIVYLRSLFPVFGIIVQHSCSLACCNTLRKLTRFSNQLKLEL